VSDSFMKTMVMGLLVAGLMSVSFWASAASKLETIEHKASADAHKVVHAVEDEAASLKEKMHSDTDDHQGTTKAKKAGRNKVPAVHENSHSDHH
jgi:hypothetical protein